MDKPVQQIILMLMCCLNIISTAHIFAQERDEKSVYRIARSGDWQVLAITYSSNGHLSSTIELYDSSTGRLLRTADLSPYVPRRIALSPTGDRIAYAGTEGDLGIFDINTSAKTSVFNSSAINVDALAWNPLNDELAYGIGSGIYVLDAHSGSVIHTIAAGTERVVEIAWSPDGQKLATSHYNEDIFNLGTTTANVKIWDLSTEENSLTSPILTIENRGGGNIDWSPDTTQLSILEKNHLFIYDFSTHQSIVDLPFEEETPATVVWNAPGDLLATGGSAIRIWNTSTWQVTRVIPVEEIVGTLQWSLDGQHLFNDGGPSGLYLDTVPVAEIQPPDDSGRQLSDRCRTARLSVPEKRRAETATLIRSAPSD